jgi:hypothetical protein
MYPDLMRGVIGTVALTMQGISAVGGLKSYLTKSPLSFTNSEITKALRGPLFYSIKPTSLLFSSCRAIAAFGHEDTSKDAHSR